MASLKGWRVPTPGLGSVGLLALTFGSVVLLAQACGAPPTPAHPQNPLGPPGVETPLGSAAPAASSASVTSSAEIPWQDFQPVLASPGLQAVAALQRAGSTEHAARLLEQQLRAGSVTESTGGDGELGRLYYLLGRLYSDAGVQRASAEAFGRSASQRWALSSYAAFAEGTSWLRAGLGEQALGAFSKVRGVPVLEASLALSRAQTLELMGRWAEAMQHYDRFLDRTPPPDGWQALVLHIAETLLSRLEQPGSSSSAETVRAIRHLRRLLLSTTQRAQAERARQLEQALLAKLPERERPRAEAPTPEESLGLLEAHSRAGRSSDVKVLAEDLLQRLGSRSAAADVACQTRVLLGKALADLRQWGRASEVVGEAARLCIDQDLRARALFLAGRYAVSDKRYSLALRSFEQLEREIPGHRLADDARLQRARCLQELGDEAGATRLLTDVVQDYPEGDVALDGAFQLALKQIERNDWGAATTLLARAVEQTRVLDSSRQVVDAGRERYFLARALEATGEPERALDSYEALVRELPLGYYMLSAYSRLAAKDPGRAEQVVHDALHVAREEPFAIQWQGTAEQPEFQRALELLRQGALDWARQELEALGVSDQGAAPQLLWSAALLYDAGGAAEWAHDLARRHPAEWAFRWPAGGWRTAWRLAFPTPYWPTIRVAALAQDVEPSLIYAVIREESAFDPKAVSPADAHGLMQLIPATARHFGKKAGLPHDVASLYRPEINIPLGCMVLANYSSQFDGNPLLGIPGYNAGPNRPKRWLTDNNATDFDVWVELIPFRETRRYTKRVLSSRATYAFLYGNDLERVRNEPVGPEPLRREALELPLQISRERGVALNSDGTHQTGPKLAQ